MAISFKDMQDRINLDYLNRTDFTNETKRAIIRAIKHYERTRLWFNQTATAIAANIATFSIPMPADFIALDMVTLTANGGAPQIVNQRSFERVTYKNGSGLSGTPVECAVFNNALWMTPKPSSAFPITINYTFRLVELANDADTNFWTTEAEDLITFHAAADMLQNVVRGRPDDVAALRDMESVALASMKMAKSLHMNQGEDLGILGPIHRQDPQKTDGSPQPGATNPTGG